MTAIDLSFDLHGDSLPADYALKLWQALLQHVPELAENTDVGVIPLRGPSSGGELLLPKRAKLALRLPLALLDAAQMLSGQELQIGSATLRLGRSKTREILPYSTLHAHLVAGPADETEFMEMIHAALAALQVSSKLICGRHHALDIEGEQISGFSLVMHDLKDEDSLRMQYAGIGGNRHLGCGIFLPYKAISGLE